MNATDEKFLSRVDPGVIGALFHSYPKLKRPVAGVIGGINERLDFDLLLKVADLADVGTLLLVGPVAKPNDPGVVALLRHPRVLAVGNQPHESLPAWQQALDVALIPYRESEFNRFCSPLRLFDHLAAARPIVATAACPQIGEFANWVAIANDPFEFLEAVNSALRPHDEIRLSAMRVHALEQTWRARAIALNSSIGSPGSLP
jgi:hypothetical protein